MKSLRDSQQHRISPLPALGFIATAKCVGGKMTLIPLKALSYQGPAH
jgi:hypothetical protein